MEYILKDLEADLRSLKKQLSFLLTSLELSSKKIEDLSLEELRKLKQACQDKEAKKEISDRITNKLIGGKLDGIY